MICGNEGVIVLIPVRGGSKGIVRKNMELLGGHPLMAWPIKIAQTIDEVDRIIVSTEDVELSKIGLKYGAEWENRDASLADDTTGIYDVIIDLKSRLRQKSQMARYMILLEATSPFRSDQMIRDALSLLSQGYDSVATFCTCRTHPNKAWHINDDEPSIYIDGADPWTTRQLLPPAYELTGELYGFDLNLLDEKSSSLMVGRCAPLIIDSEKIVDINTYRDLLLARLMFDTSPLTEFI